LGRRHRAPLEGPNRHQLQFTGVFAGQPFIPAASATSRTTRAGIGSNGRNIAPFEFGVLFDLFHTMRRWRWISRDSIFSGAAFDRLQHQKNNVALATSKVG
jgi:hypothetical protein